MRTLICALLLLAHPLCAAAAIEDIPFLVRHTDVSPKRGSHNSVFAAARDADGFIWLATLKGVYVYDGHLVRPVLEDVLQGTAVNDMHIDSGDVLWLATNSGVLAYPLKTGKFRWHRSVRGDNGLISNTVTTLFEDRRGTLWAGTASRRHAEDGGDGDAFAGLHRYEPSFDRFEQVDAVRQSPIGKISVRDICEDANRNLWIATNQGLYRLNGNRGPAALIPSSTGEPYSVRRVAFDGAGNLWANWPGRGLLTMPANARKEELARVAELKVKHILDLYADSEGDIWICSIKGLYRLAHREGRFYRHPFIFQERPVRELEAVTFIAETTSRSFWIGTINQGVLHHATHSGAAIIELAAPDQEGERQVFDANHVLTAPDGRVYVASEKGDVFRSRGPVSSDRLTLSPKLAMDPFVEGHKVKALDWADGFLLCGLENALLRVDPEGETELVQTFPDPEKIFEDKDIEHIAPAEGGRIWFASKFAVFSWAPGEAVARLEARQPGNEPIIALEHDGPTLRIAKATSITEIDTVSGRQTRIDIPASAWDGDATLRSVLVQPDGTIWIGTSRSAFRFKRGFTQLSPILAAGQRPIANVLSFWPDDAGNVWLHTQEKIYSVKAGSTRAVEALLGAEHPSLSISSPPAPLAGNALAYGHSKGLLLAVPARLLTQQVCEPKISEVRIFGRPLPASPLGRVSGNLELDHRQNYLTFSFSVPEPLALQPPRFFYFLEGVDSTWNDSGSQTTVSYAHIKPGSYVLHVKYGPEGAAITSMGITIRAPWWMTGWAKAGYAMALVFTILGASRIFARIQTTRIRKEMLENLVMQDPLTEVPNRRKFKEVLAAEKSRCKRSNHQISVLMIDIDFFKGFNDRFGHQAGDRALRTVAQAVNISLKRPEDFVARFGGEEFVVVLPSTNRAGAERVAQKIQDAIFQANIPYPGSPLSDRITLSIGISTFSPQTDLHIDSGLFSADQALYQAKRNGRNCVFYKDHCLALTPVKQ
jgi:diguanylate cyclase (GGDEF)-like protein